VLVIATSTGGTLAAYAATEADMAVDVAGIVFVSPNFALAEPTGRVLQWPLAGLIAETLLGPERGFEPINEAQATYWTEWHPTMAVVRMGAIMREVRLRDLSLARMPALFVFSDADQVVSPPATRRVAERWGGPAQLAPQTLPSEGRRPLGPCHRGRHRQSGDDRRRDGADPRLGGPASGLIVGPKRPIGRRAKVRRRLFVSTSSPQSLNPKKSLAETGFGEKHLPAGRETHAEKQR
jgi:hypothetical protein